MTFLTKDLLKQVFNQLKTTNPELVLAAYTDPAARQMLRDVIDAQPLLKKALDTPEKVDYALQELVGLGFIERIAADPAVTDLSYNGTAFVVQTNDQKYIYPEPVDEADVIQAIMKFADAVGKEFTAKAPILDAQLGYMRLNAVHRSLSPFGTTMAIRISRPHLVLTPANFEGFADPFVLDLLRAMVLSQSNIIISGETGVGKTELQKLLISYIPFDEKICMIEDTPESHLKTLFPDKDIHSWVTSGTTGMTALIKAALRNDPKWLIVSETRGQEAYEMLQAVLSGHRLITTAHTYDARATASRFVNMAKMGYAVDEQGMLADINRYFHFDCHLKATRLDGHIVRYLSEIIEFRGDEPPVTLYRRWETSGHWASETGVLSLAARERMAEHHVALNWQEVGA